MRPNSGRRVLLISADGMRPDLYDPALMPTVAGLIRQGTRLTDYHATYPTHSRVNITTISTGCLPGRHGITANVFRANGATDDGIIDTADVRHIDALDRFTGGRAIQRPTVPEILARRGRRSQIVASSSDAAGLIWNRTCPESVFDLNQSIPRPGVEAVKRKLGPVPPESLPHRIPHVEYTARAVSEHYLDDPDLDFIGVWLSEPDHSLHYYGAGSPQVEDALVAVDRAVADILHGLDRRGIRDQFEIVLISDHGHSTVSVRKSLGEYLDEALRSRFTNLPWLPTASDFIYANPDDPAPTLAEMAQLVDWLQDQPWCGAVLAGDRSLTELPGVLSLADAWGDHLGDRTPLLAVSPAWSHRTNTFGTPGAIAGLTEQVALRSTHGSASPYELHAFCVACGPAFSAGTTSVVPAGAQDLAPTILHLLGIPDGYEFDGRVLSELMQAYELKAPVRAERVATPRVERDGTWRPALILHDVATSTYIHSAINGRSWAAEHERLETATAVVDNQEREPHE